MQSCPPSGICSIKTDDRSIAPIILIIFEGYCSPQSCIEVGSLQPNYKSTINVEVDAGGRCLLIGVRLENC